MTLVNIWQHVGLVSGVIKGSVYILINIIILRWLFFQHEFSKVWKMLKRLIWVRYEFTYVLYLPSTYMIGQDCEMYVCVQQCSIIVGNVSLPNTRSIYSLVMNSSDKLVTRCVFESKIFVGGFERLQHMLGKSRRYDQLCNTCFGALRYTGAKEHIYISTFHWEFIFLD